MEPHKNTTEQDFREKLDAREIIPSVAAWDRLDAMLTVAEEKKSKRGYGWLYIAASILGFLLIGTVFLTQTEEVIDQGRDRVVFENQSQKPATENEEVAPIQSDSEAIASSENPTIKTKNINHQSKSTNQNQSTTIINQNSIIRAKGELALGNPIEAVNQVPDQKLIASNPINPKPDQPNVKVEELLAAVQSNNANPKTSVKVNAKSLLSEADKDVNLSFREKMLRRASEVASTVANRNNE